ncbi:MAG: type II toxin-antitoxin system RelE/ParE family toxin [Gulosibacter sp.]|uniref:type II toxin-antitoxin system RelE/ParE family toxin n=1 Tax=Gulosibacter sp. TaxID=2817531 RepID=UPI003F90BE1C
MTFQLVFRRTADDDYSQAIDWYLAEAPHEVERFVEKIDLAIEVIRDRPLLARVAYRGLRNVKTDVFPYHLWYRVFEESELIEVVAVLHYAQDRLRLEYR